MNPLIFREYDIRGIADEELTDEVAFDVARAFGTLVRRSGGRRVILGHDVRLSSPRIHGKAAEGLQATGLDVLDTGFLVTPGVYFAAVSEEADGSMQITGSHNPAEYNGFKMTLQGGAVYGERIQEMLALIDSGDLESGTGSLRQEDYLDRYLDAVTSRVSLARPPRIVIDAGNGTAGPAAVAIFERLGCEVEALYCDPDGSFPNHLADPTVEAFMQDLIGRVQESGADLGLGFDGDGDRLGVVDRGGRMVWGDQILALLARDVLERLGEGQEIIFDVKCSQALVEDIEAHGGVPRMWKTGHSLIKAEMRRSGAPIAGEMSGHLFFKEGWYGFDDALYAGARLLGILDRWGRRLDEVVDSLPHYYATPELRVSCPDDEKFDVVAEVTRRFESREDVQVVDIDGARVIFADGWGLVRASNTQPVIVLRFEGRTPEALQMVKEAFVKVLEDFPTVALEELETGGGGH